MLTRLLKGAFMSKKPKPELMAAMLGDASISVEHRRQILRHLCTDDSEDAQAAIAAVFQSLAAGQGESLAAKKAQELAALIKEMQEGPLRFATFLGLIEGDGAGPGGACRARVVLQDGTAASTAVPDADLADGLRCGDSVLLESQGRALLFRDQWGDHPVGREGRLERRIDRHRVEVALRDFDREVFLASARLIEQLDSGAVAPGATLVVCDRRAIAFDALPPADGLSHYRFLVKDRPPDVVIRRDIGAPPAFLEELAEHVRMEMTCPALTRRYRLERVVTKLLTGVSGSGKTLCVEGFWRRMYEVMGEVTGAAVSDLPPRVMRLRMAQVLSKWLGESDKQIDRFFDEVDQLSDELWEAPDGELYELPVLVIVEECDGLARSRGDDAIHDRIQTTLLQRLDTTSQTLRDRLVIFLFTTNVPQVVDPAFLRRAGGTTEKFGRLARRSFLAVLHKHLQGLPFQEAAADGPLGGPQPAGEDSAAARQAAAELCAWLYSPNGDDRGLVELTWVGSSHPVVKHRRDFLTAALVHRAVQEASREARRAERDGSERPGLTTAGLMRAFDRQIRSVVDQIRPDNAHNHLDLPDGVRVAAVRRIEPPAVLPFDLQRAS